MIRIANKKDLNNLKELWYECFIEHDGKDGVDYYFDHHFDLDHTLVLYEDDNLICSMQLNQHQLMINNKVESVSFVVGVATFNKYRKQGYMKKILNYGIEYSRDVLKQKLMILQAYNWDIYRPFGFEDYYYINECIVNVDDLNNKIIELDSYNEQSLLKSYQLYTSKLNGYKIRDYEYYQKYLKMLESDGLKVASYLENYIIYKKNKKIFEVVEAIYNDETELFDLIKTVVSNDKEIDQIKINVDKNFKFDNNIFTVNKNLFMMLKIHENINIDISKDNLYIMEYI